MTLQETFETAARHLFEQGEQSIAGKMCMYRDPYGRKCVVGRFIADDEYSPEMDIRESEETGTGLNNLIRRFPRVAEKWDEPTRALLADLQDVHDGAHYWHSTENMRAALRGVATDHHLDAAFLAGLPFNDR